MKNKIILINKSITASLLIALGNYALLKVGNPLGPFLFALGLLGVCYMGQNLFTGKCGFLFEDKIKWYDLLLILVINLIAGYIFGLLFSIADKTLIPVAVDKVNTWTFDIAFFIKALLCGVVMYIAVYLYRQKTPLGIIYGIPLFIFCGFQHCIANVITLGVARMFSWTLILAVLGNFLGSLFIWFLSNGLKEDKK